MFKSIGYAVLDLDTVGSDPSHCIVRGCLKDRAKRRRVCYQHHLLAWRLNHPIKAAYAILRDHAKRSKREFTITLDDFTKLVEPTEYITKKGNTKYDLHLDRKNPLKGYIPGNLAVITCSENSVKGATKDKAQWSEYYSQEIADENHEEEENPF